MIVLTAGAENTLEYYRELISDSVESCTIVDQSDGTVVETLDVTNDITRGACTGVVEGEYTFTCEDVEAGVTYKIVSPLGPAQRITVASHNGEDDVNIITHPFYATMATATVYGLRATASYTPAATYAGKPLLVLWSIADGATVREQAIVVAYRAKCPITADDVLEEFPRIESGALPKWQELTGVGWQPQVDKAWERIRNEMYSMSPPLILDQIINPDVLREYVLAHVAKSIIRMGHTPSGEDDIGEAITRYSKILELERMKTRQYAYAVDYGDDNKDTSVGSRQGVVFNVYNTDYQR